MKQHPWAFYDWLIDSVTENRLCDAAVIGQVWTLTLAGESAGLAMTPMQYTRTLDFPGRLAGSDLAVLAEAIKSWQPFEASLAMAAINAANPFDADRFDDVVALENETGNLAVFDYFLPKLGKGKIVVIGRYPGLEIYESEYDLQVIERNPCDNDYPDQAAEYLIAEVDWVFITSSSITNKTFPRLAELSANAVTVLMGPSTPWLPGLSDWGIDFLAGVVVNDVEQLAQTVAEGGGRRIFDEAVSYKVADIGKNRMAAVKDEIALLAAKRDVLKKNMDDWYMQQSRRFPDLAQLEKVQDELSRLDLIYKRLWDARHG